ncbi:MAG: archaellin/type IV pilin N-terminal domain-containing protein [Candidatus Bathyarchaeia archaeon]
MKILKSKKALSPVVASIILIAVTVAVSIAVAAWMGALTIGFMGSSSMTITNVQFEGTQAGSKYINCTLKNTGTNTVTVATVKVNGQPMTTVTFNPSSGTFTSGATGSVRIKIDWVAGNPYKIDLFDGSGQVVGSYQATAPS